MSYYPDPARHASRIPLCMDHYHALMARMQCDALRHVSSLRYVPARPICIVDKASCWDCLKEYHDQPSPVLCDSQMTFAARVVTWADVYGLPATAWEEV